MNTQRILLSACLALVLALAVVPAQAAEGRIPIWAPITIGPGAEGKYILTRDITALVGAPAIDILGGTLSVDIDLNGFTVYGSDQNAIQARGTDVLTIRNGTVWGGLDGIHAEDCRKVVLEDLKVQFPQENGIVLWEVQNFAVRRNIVVSAQAEGVFVDGQFLVPDATVEGVIEDNLVRECGRGITLYNGSSVGIKNNRIDVTYTADGIFVSPGPSGITGCSSCQIAENSVEEATANGLWLSFFEGGKIVNNTILGAQADGIFLDVESNNNLVLDNVTSENGSNGLWVQSGRNHVERNVMNENGFALGVGWGLYFQNASFNNTYRGNTAQGNLGIPALCGGFPATTDFCDVGAGNVSPFNQPPNLAGDNLMPGLL